MKTIFSFLLLSISFHVFGQPNLSVTEFADGFTRPINIKHAGDDRLFIVEQAGVIKIIDGSGTTLSTPFFDIRDRVNDGSGTGEQGLLGLAFPPDYQTTGIFYVNYTAGSGSGRTNISRFKTDPNNPNIALEASEDTILDFNQTAANHNGGDLHFGSDGYLYIATGDGGGAGDLDNNAQNRMFYLGKILRIDVDTLVSYKIPPDNPYANDANRVKEIWSWGLRNPWRFSFDKETGDMWIADVGQVEREEVNFEPANSQGDVNYGWRCREGSLPFNPFQCNNTYTDPIFDYPHSNATGGFSITGGYVYRGTDMPAFAGTYVCADYVSGNFWTISPEDNTDEWLVNRQNSLLTSVSSFGEDVNGEIYLTKLNNGKIYKLTADCADTTININITIDGNLITSNATIGALTWFKDGNELAGENNPTIELQGEGIYQLEVSINDNGCHYTATSNLLNSLGDFECPDTSVNITIVSDGNTIFLNDGPSGIYTWVVNGIEVLDQTDSLLDLSPFCCDLELTIQLIVQYELFFGEDTCSYIDTSNIIDIPTSLLNHNATQIVLYPNPASKIVTAILPSNVVTKIKKIYLVNIEGKRLNFAYKLEGNNLIVDVSKLNSGSYFLEVIANDDYYLGKILKK